MSRGIDCALETYRSHLVPDGINSAKGDITMNTGDLYFPPLATVCDKSVKIVHSMSSLRPCKAVSPIFLIRIYDLYIPLYQRLQLYTVACLSWNKSAIEMFVESRREASSGQKRRSRKDPTLLHQSLRIYGGRVLTWRRAADKRRLRTSILGIINLQYARRIVLQELRLLQGGLSHHSSPSLCNALVL